MSTASSGTALSLRREATQILEGSGLRSELEAFGRLVVHGSYALDLMVWRDLDLYLLPRKPLSDSNWFFELGSRVAHLLRPSRMHFRDETRGPSEGLPRGLYWGVYLSDGVLAPWKVDLWAVYEQELDRLVEYQSWVAARLTRDSRVKILEIKAAVHQHPEYRRSFGAKDVYDAVLKGGVLDVGGFWDHLRKMKGRGADA